MNKPGDSKPIDGSSFSNLGPCRLSIDHGVHYMKTVVHVREKGGAFRVVDSFKGKQQDLERVFPKGSTAECKMCLGGVQLSNNQVEQPKCLTLGHRMEHDIWAICTRYSSK